MLSPICLVVIGSVKKANTSRLSFKQIIEIITNFLLKGLFVHAR